LGGIKNGRTFLGNNKVEKKLPSWWAVQEANLEPSDQESTDRKTG